MNAAKKETGSVTTNIRPGVHRQASVASSLVKVNMIDFVSAAVGEAAQRVLKEHGVNLDDAPAVSEPQLTTNPTA